MGAPELCEFDGKADRSGKLVLSSFAGSVAQYRECVLSRKQFLRVTIDRGVFFSFIFFSGGGDRTDNRTKEISTYCFSPGCLLDSLASSRDASISPPHTNPSQLSLRSLLTVKLAPGFVPRAGSFRCNVFWNCWTPYSQGKGGARASTRSPQGAPVLGGGSCVMRIRAKMRWHVSGRGVMSSIQIGSWTRPVTRCRLEKSTWHGDRDRSGRRRHQVELRVTVARHEELALIFVRRWICSCWLSRRGQPLEVELVSVPLAMDLCHDVLVVVVPATPNHLNTAACLLLRITITKPLYLGFFQNLV